MGDEIILTGLMKILLEQWKEIYVATTDKKWLESFHKQFFDTKNITYIMELPKWFRSFFRFIKNFGDIKYYFKTDTVVVWGGEILTEETAYCRIYWFMSIWISLIIWKKLYLMWGIQVPKKIGNKLLYKFLIKRSKHIYARDYDTVDELQKDGIKNVSFFMDTSFFLEKANSKKGKYRWKIENKQDKEKFVIINLNRKWEKYYNDLIKKTKDYINKWYNIYYSPVCKSPADDDMKFYEKISLEIPNIKILDWEIDFQWFLEKLAQAKDVITPRLHLFLIASYLGINMKVFEYQRKIVKMKKVLNTI